MKCLEFGFELPWSGPRSPPRAAELPRHWWSSCPDLPKYGKDDDKAWYKHGMSMKNP